MPCYVERTGFTGVPQPTHHRSASPPPQPRPMPSSSSPRPAPPPVARRSQPTAARPTSPAPVPHETPVNRSMHPQAQPPHPATSQPRPATSSQPQASTRLSVHPTESALSKVTDALRFSEALLGVPAELTREGASDAERALAAGWARIAVRPHNSIYAGQRFPLEDRRPDLAKKYPNSVQFDVEGFPDFSPYAVATVNIGQLHPSNSDNDIATVSRSSDFVAADRLSGWSEPARKAAHLTWHHVQDGRTLMLVPTDLHQAIGHIGGVAHEERVAGPQSLITNYILYSLREAEQD
jgi:hypothetical protein